MSKLLHDKGILKGLLKEKKPNWRKRAVWAAVSALVFALFLAPGAVWAKSKSRSDLFSDGASLHVAGILLDSDIHGCRKWQSSVSVIPSEGTVHVTTIVSFHKTIPPAVFIGIVPGILSLFSPDITINGEKKDSIKFRVHGSGESYLAGTVCGGNGHIGMTVKGVGLRTNSVRQVTVKL